MILLEHETTSAFRIDLPPKMEPPTELELRASWLQELVRAGMEWARLRGKRIGRPKVTEREGFLQRFEAVVERVGPGGLSRRQAARELAIGYATLKRLLDA